MAIYSLHHQPIGKSTQERPYTARAHIRYITRGSALTHLDGARMPVSRRGAGEFLRAAEDADRKNARVVDKVMLALPRELDAGQRHALVRSFAEEVTCGRAAWLAAYHDRGKDADNPHCHLVIRDRDAESGKRVAGLSEKGSTERLRELWERHVNAALEGAGRAERVDRRTLKAQGKGQAPTIHEGPRSREMDRRGAKPTSRVRSRRNGRGARRRTRQVDYPNIDGGRSRPAYNRAIRSQGRETEAECWAAADAAERRHDLDELRAIHQPHHAPTPEYEERMRVHMARLTMADNDRDPSGRPIHKPGVERVPDGIDLAEWEMQLETKDKQIAEVEAQTFMLPFRRKALERLNRERLLLAEKVVSAREHVRANPIQAEIYERRKDELEKAAAQEAEEAADKARRRASLREHMRKVRPQPPDAPGIERDREGECEP